MSFFDEIGSFLLFFYKNINLLFRIVLRDFKMKYDSLHFFQNLHFSLTSFE